MTGEAKVYEAEAEVTRNRMAATIDELQVRLSPKALLDTALGSVSAAGTNAVASVRGAAAGHPIMLGVAGLAAGIGLLAHSRLNRSTVEYGDSYAAYADYDDGYAANLADSAPAIGKTRAHLDAFQHQAHETVDDNPLGVIAVGLATGALLAAIVPVSRVEAGIAGQVRARFTAAAEAALAAAKDELDPAKLSLLGGTTGITERLTASLIRIVSAAGGALARPVRTGSGA